MDFTSIPFSNLKTPLNGIIFGAALRRVSSQALIRGSSTHTPTHPPVSLANAEEPSHLTQLPPGVVPLPHLCPVSPIPFRRLRAHPGSLPPRPSGELRLERGGGGGGAAISRREESHPPRPSPRLCVRGRQAAGGTKGKATPPPPKAKRLRFPHAKGRRNGQEYSGPRRGGRR